jgi:hypothetical protein
MHSPDLHARAARAAAELLARYGTRLPPDLETTLSYYRSCACGYDHAAKQLLVMASIVNATETE